MLYFVIAEHMTDGLKLTARPVTDMKDLDYGRCWYFFIEADNIGQSYLKIRATFPAIESYNIISNHKCRFSCLGKCVCGITGGTPHHDGDFSYLCGSNHCKCAQ